MKDFVRETLMKAGEEILKFYGNASVIYTKTGGVNDVVTEADLASNKIISEAIKKNYPDHGIISEEESGHLPDADYQWYIDPLDGTKNFSTHTPMFGIILGLSYKGKMKMGAIYLPVLKDYCYAEEGEGAYLNGQKISCSGVKELSGTYGIGTWRMKPEYQQFQQGLNDIGGTSIITNAIGCSAIAGIWASSGKRDWYLGPGGNSWDYAATSLIAREAGAVVSNFKGTDYMPGDKGILVSNPTIHPQLLELVMKNYGKQ